MLRSQLSDVSIPSNVSLSRFILQEAAKYGNRLAFVDGITGESITFNKFIDHVRRVGSALRRRGVRKGDVILICSPNSVTYPVILHAGIAIGAVITTCNPLYTSGELLNQLKDSAARYVVTVPETADKLDTALRSYGHIQEKFIVGHHTGYTSYSELLQDDGSGFLEADINSREDLCILPYSSGTTGPSKGVMLSHYNMVAVVSQVIHPAIDSSRPGKEVFVAFLPFYHIYAILVFLNMGIFRGQTTVVMPRFELKTFLELCERYKATMLYLAPPVIVLMSKSPLMAKYNLGAVRRVTSGAAPLAREQAEEFLAALNAPHVLVSQGYGMTETSTVTHMSPIVGWKHGSVGILLPNMECKVIDTETGAVLGANVDGEICVRGPTNMQGYLNRPEATKATIDRDNWLHTGDIGHYDEDGHFYIVDRLKELIKYKGLQVPPAELEGLLLTHPGVADAGVIGIEDAMAGELPRAYIVRKPGSDVTREDIMKYVAARVAPYKRLRGGVIFLPEIPKSPSGKILRRTLRQYTKIQEKSKL